MENCLYFTSSLSNREMEIMVVKWFAKILWAGYEDSGLSGMDGIQTGIIKCKGCDTLFEKRANKQWCSGVCYQRAKRRRSALKRSPVKCTECGEMFTPLRTNSKRCSKLCQNIWKKRYSAERCSFYRENRRKRRQPILCRNCNAQFFPNHVLKKYCSPKCKRDFTRESKIRKPIKLMWGVPQLREVEEKDIKTSAYADEIRAYKESGKKIISLPSLDNPSTPDVTIDAEDSEYPEKETIIIKQYLGEKNG